MALDFTKVAAGLSGSRLIRHLRDLMEIGGPSEVTKSLRPALRKIPRNTLEHDLGKDAIRNLSTHLTWALKGREFGQYSSKRLNSPMRVAWKHLQDQMERRDLLSTPLSKFTQDLKAGLPPEIQALSLGGGITRPIAGPLGKLPG